MVRLGLVAAATCGSYQISGGQAARFLSRICAFECFMFTTRLLVVVVFVVVFKARHGHDKPSRAILSKKHNALNMNMKSICKTCCCCCCCRNGSNCCCFYCCCNLSCCHDKTGPMHRFQLATGNWQQSRPSFQFLISPVSVWPYLPVGNSYQLLTKASDYARPTALPAAVSQAASA